MRGNDMYVHVLQEQIRPFAELKNSFRDVIESGFALTWVIDSRINMSILGRGIDHNFSNLIFGQNHRNQKIIQLNILESQATD